MGQFFFKKEPSILCQKSCKACLSSNLFCGNYTLGVFVKKVMYKLGWYFEDRHWDIKLVDFDLGNVKDFAPVLVGQVSLRDNVLKYVRNCYWLLHIQRLWTIIWESSAWGWSFLVWWSLTFCNVCRVKKESAHQQQVEIFIWGKRICPWSKTKTYEFGYDISWFNSMKLRVGYITHNFDKENYRNYEFYSYWIILNWFMFNSNLLLRVNNTNLPWQNFKSLFVASY